MAKRSTLTPRQIQLVTAYAGNISQAAKSIKLEYRYAKRMMKDPRVKAAIEKKMNAVVEESGKRLAKDMSVTTQNVLKELARLAFYDPRKFFNQDGSAVPIPDLDDDTAMALSGFEVVEQFEGSGDDRVFTGYLKKYKTCDKGHNLERLGKHLGMFIDRYMRLPDDFDSRTLEEQQHFAQHGYYPDVDQAQPGAQNSDRPGKD